MGRKPRGKEGHEPKAQIGQEWVVGYPPQRPQNPAWMGHGRCVEMTHLPRREVRRRIQRDGKESSTALTGVVKSDVDGRHGRMDIQSIIDPDHGRRGGGVAGCHGCMRWVEGRIEKYMGNTSVSSNSLTLDIREIGSPALPFQLRVTSLPSAATGYRVRGDCLTPTSDGTRLTCPS